MIVTRESIEARCIPITESGCLLWIGAWSKQGYGNIFDSVQQRYTQAHREMARFAFGDYGDLIVCHKCDTPACCNPKHLFIGTVADNAQDMIRKGRSRCGEWQRQRTHCPQGHPYSGNNLRIMKHNGGRICMICTREQQKLFQRERRRRIREACHG
jgi:hypothetical protein